MTDLNVLHISEWDDIGGASYLLASGFKRHPQPGISVRSAVRQLNYIKYPRDLAWHDLAWHFNEANVLHVQNDFLSMNSRNPQGKRLVITYHGTGFREKPGHYLGQQQAWGAIGTVSTLDLWLQAPNDVTWLPANHDVDALAAMRQPREPGAPIRVGHAPTNRRIKSTDAFLRACEGLPVEVVLIEKRTWADTLAIKATCDIWYDQVVLGYGNNSIEAWGMGLPVICGAAEPTLDEMRRRFGAIPFVQATENTIRDAIERLLEPEERRRWGLIGQTHARTWHDRYPVEVAAAIYRGEQ